jgi:hypothetical protein
MQMIERDSNFNNINLNKKENVLAIQDFCNEQLFDLPNLVSLDINLDPVGEYMDGNIQICLEKNAN